MSCDHAAYGGITIIACHNGIVMILINVVHNTQVVLTKSEEKEVRSLRPKGLTLLGFKPLSALKDWHQLTPSRFVYPDERAVKGSTAAFVALHAACQPQTSKLDHNDALLLLV